MTSFDMKVARLQGYVYENLEISENGAGRVLLSKEVLEKFNLRDAETSSIVGTPGSIRDVQSWAILWNKQTDTIVYGCVQKPYPSTKLLKSTMEVDML